MKQQYSISILTLVLIISTTFIITTTGLAKSILFGIFWAALILLLGIIVSMKSWSPSTWMAFASFCTATLVGVLISARVVQDEIALGVVLIGLFMVSAVINAIPERKILRIQPRRRPEVKVVAPLTGSKYHQPDCRLVKYKTSLRTYAGKREAEAAGLKACKICH